MRTVIVLESFPYIRQRMKDLLSEEEIIIYESEASMDFFKRMNDLKNEVDLVILDVNLKNEDGFDVLAKLRETRPSIPVMIVTSLGTREGFARGIKDGAVDYLLIPFEDKVFKERVLNNLQKEARSHDPLQKLVYLNFQDYLSGEIKKASKGNYKVTIVMTTLFKDTATYDEKAESEYLIVSKTVYEGLKDILWDTDLLFKYGPQSYIGVFPFCDEVNINKVLNKVEEKYKVLKESEQNLEEYDLKKAYVTYDIDGENKDKLLEKLFARMSAKIFVN